MIDEENDVIETREELASVKKKSLLLEDPPKSDVKRQNSEQYLEKAYSEERINELSEEEVDY